MLRSGAKFPPGITHGTAGLLVPLRNFPKCNPLTVCTTRLYSKEQTQHMPPLSQKLDSAHLALRPPRRSKTRIALGIGVVLSATVAGGALLMLDPLGIITEKKPLASAPKPRDKVSESVPSKKSPLSSTKDSTSAATVSGEAIQHATKANPVTLAKQLHGEDTLISQKVPDDRSRTDTLTSIAENSVQLLVSGKRTLEEEVMIAKHQRDVEIARQVQKDAEEAELLAQRRREELERKRKELYAATKAERNKELEKMLSKDVSEALEQTQSAIVIHEKARDLCKEHALLLDQALDAERETDAQKYWPRIYELRQQSLHEIAAADASSNAISKQLKGVLDMIKEARADEMTSRNPSLSSYEAQAKQILSDLDKSIYQRADQPSDAVLKRYCSVLEKEQELFQNELENLPDFKPGKKGDKFSGEELSELVLFAHRRIYQLKKQLREQECMQDHRMKEILDEQKETLEVKYKERLADALNSQKVKCRQDLDDELESMSKQHEKTLREELARQGLAKNLHAQDMLDVQYQQLAANDEKVVEERIAAEKKALVESTADVLDRVERLQRHAHDRADVMNAVSKIQKLISSAQNLHLSLAETEISSEAQYELVRVSQAVALCKESAPHDAFVQTVLSSIPDEALTEGIYTQTSLENRFNNVYNMCKKGALFPNSDNVFFSSLSQLYGKLLLFTIKPRYDNVSDFYDNGIEGMDTKDLLIQAQYFMKKRHIAEAIKCMVQLQGLPRTLAEDWIKQAQLYMEVHQAANAINQYALLQGFSQIL